MKPPSAPRVAPCQPVEVELSRHCVERYHQHFQRCLDLGGAEEDLRRLLELHALISYARPSWVVPLGPTDSCVAYVEIDGILALPLVPHHREHGVLVAKTCIARGGITHAERERRRRAKARRRPRSRR